ncbi:uncharacterized protein LOC112689440 isoform X2 [Sipha flava]|nr:uncharacterized protein LOC112689440 isoform X2 [Sipha flava]XP_025418961.1 uncharacterized protein LOC112689440 isoform X2 [Sipha flava]XP_025418969.1 uncharacterized protein LOC112689440 isoform X2 [Sipha flava]
MADTANITDSSYGDTPYPDDGTSWLDSPTSNQVLGIEETEETSTMPSDMIPTGTGGPIVIRTEEAFIVICVMILWVAAIALFFNRWGKIRMLEPYQPKFHEEEHRPSCPMVELASASGIGHSITGGHRTSFSKFNVNSCLEPSAIFQTIQPTHRALQIRPRQNSMFAGGGALPGACGPPLSGHCTLMAGRPRKAKSAADIKSLVQHECGPARTSRSMLPMTVGAAAVAAVADRRVSCAASSFGGYGGGGGYGGSGYGSLMVSAVKERRSCSLFPSPGSASAAEKRLFSSSSSNTPPAPCLCDMPFGGQSGSSSWASAKRDFLLTPSTSLGGGPGFSGGAAGRRTSCGMDHLCPTSITLKDRRPSFNNVIAQVTAERRPSSSMLRISNV